MGFGGEGSFSFIHAQVAMAGVCRAGSGRGEGEKGRKGMGDPLL